MKSRGDKPNRLFGAQGSGRGGWRIGSAAPWRQTGLTSALLRRCIPWEVWFVETAETVTFAHVRG